MFFKTTNQTAQFAKDEETENRLTPLDVLVERIGKKVSTSVYRKVTHRKVHTFYVHHTTIQRLVWEKSSA